MDKVWMYLLSHTLHLVASVFLHEPSFIELKPTDPGLNNEADFGFSIAYQNAIKPNLVIGSPHSDLDGQVYNCPIEEVLKNSEACHKIDINVTKLAPKTIRDTINTEQRFCLGASIAATPTYFLTCAPLWTTIGESNRRSELRRGAFGTCFIYDGQNVTQYKGKVEHYIKRKIKFRNIDAVIGGIGWSTLVDQKNDYILIGKPAVISDILRVKISNPTGLAISMVENKKTLFSDVNNIGYALAKGNFFMDKNDTSYFAFSMQDDYGAGKIGFASIISNSLEILIDKATKSMATITSPTEGSMFGASLLGVDLNSNDVTDLLVGAPAQVDNDILYDTGALYIYLDSDTDSVDEDKRRTVILASKEGGRFGTAIASTDIDGDNLPEIFVSAPYEDLGVGALYILPGYDVNKIITGNSRQVYLGKINYQRIQMKDTQSFGFSLQTVGDVDENGCDELAVGSPGSARVMLFRCLPAITATVSTELIEKIVKEDDDNFTVQVCVHVKYPTKPEIIKNKMSVTSNVIGRATLRKPRFEIDLLRREPKYCENFTVQLTFKEIGDYTFTTVLKYEEEFLKNKVFDNSWVVLSQSSETKRSSLNVPRHCDAAVDCTPKLEVSTFWNGDEDIHNYTLGSTEMVNVTVRVKNRGSATYDGCMRLRIQNGQLYSIGCAWEDEKKNYKICFLPQPLQRGTEYPIQMMLNMSTYTNMDANKTLQVVSYLYDHCNDKNSTTKLNYSNITLNLNTEDMQVLGSPNNFTVTDVDILNKKSKIQDEHEYEIVNKGLIKWENVKVILSILKTPFTGNYSIYKTSPSSTVKMECEEPRHTDLTVEFNCNVALMAYSSTKIYAVMDIFKDNIESNLKNGMIETSSTFSITFIPTDVTVTKRLSTHIKYQNDMSVGNKKWLIILIAVIVGVLILALVAFILYKVGFFKRKQKQRLASFRESVRRQSVKKSTSESNAPKPDCEDIDMEEMEIEVVDCVFDELEVPTSSVDNTTLIAEEGHK